MKEITEMNNLMSLVKSIENTTDKLFNRIRITFKNGYGISIIQGEYSHGGSQGLYEIAALGQDGELSGILLEESGVDAVMGYLSKEEVIEYTLRLAKLAKPVKQLDKGKKQ